MNCSLNSGPDRIERTTDIIKIDCMVRDEDEEHCTSTANSSGGTARRRRQQAACISYTSGQLASNSLIIQLISVEDLIKHN